MPRTVILDIPIDSVSFEEAQKKILEMLKDGRQHHVATPNPEMLVTSRRSAAFRHVLQNTSLNLPDGIGLLWASRWLSVPLQERVTGTDMMRALCAEQDIPPVFLLGAAPGIAKRAGEALHINNPTLVIAGVFDGSPDESEEGDLVHRINASGAQILFVAFGAPKQELWIHRNLAKMPSIRVAMGIGGAFDFVVGTQQRAPVWMQSLGLEWLFRLMKEPKRIRRIWNAVVIFPCFVLWEARSTKHENSSF